MTLESLGGGFDDIQDSAPSNPSIGDTWLDTSQDPPISKVYADLGSGGQWTTDLLDGPVSEAGSSQEVKTHDLRFIREMSRLFFDRSLSELNFSEGDYEIFVGTNDITLTSPSPIIQTGANGSAKLSFPWDISAVSHTGTTLNMQDSIPTGFSWKPDGTQLWETGRGGDLIYEYNVTTPWDISTASHTGTTLDTEDSGPQGLEWKPDGTQLWEIGGGLDQIYEHNVSTPWDISTASHTGTTLDIQDSAPKGFAWKPDGTQLWEIGAGSGKIYEYDVSTAWDISTASHTGTTLDGQDNGPTELEWEPDGTQLWEIGPSRKIYEYDVSTAWDISTASHTGTTLGTQDDNPTGFEWKPNGSQLWELGKDNKKIYESKRENAPPATLSTDISLSFTPTSVVVEDTTTGDLSVSYDIADGNGNTVTVTDGEVGTTVDTSVLTDGSLTVTVTLDTPNVSADDQLYDFALYFDQ
jgi:hypothetical protein